jgi:putative sigma-54 modulation protein
MLAPLEISFKGLESSRAVENKIAERATRLEKHFDRITHLRVVVAAPNKLAHKGQHYQIKLEISVPGSPPVIISEDPAGNNPQTDLLIAIRDAFETAERKLDQISDKKMAGARSERGRRRPAKVTNGVDADTADDVE